jgi:hypothetical protein
MAWGFISDLLLAGPGARLVHVPHSLLCIMATWERRGSSVRIVSNYRLDDRGSIPERQRIFPVASVSRPALEPIQPPI